MTNNRRVSGASSQGNIFDLTQVSEHAQREDIFLENSVNEENEVRDNISSLSIRLRKV